MGQIMKATKGTANPKLAAQVLHKIIQSHPENCNNWLFFCVHAPKKMNMNFE